MRPKESCMDSIKALFTAVGSVTGGRNGHGEAEDHSVSVNLSVPKAMGGPGRPNTTTPEHLFAVGYAACFGGALDFVAVQKKKNAKGATVTCSVSIGRRDAPAGGARGSRRRGARENLSLLARYAEQCSGRALCRGRVVGNHCGLVRR